VLKVSIKAKGRKLWDIQKYMLSNQERYIQEKTIAGKLIRMEKNV
jgi:hypothetical protein